MHGVWSNKLAGFCKYGIRERHGLVIDCESVIYVTIYLESISYSSYHTAIVQSSRLQLIWWDFASCTILWRPWPCRLLIIQSSVPPNLGILLFLAQDCLLRSNTFV